MFQNAEDKLEEIFDPLSPHFTETEIDKIVALLEPSADFLPDECRYFNFLDLDGKVGCMPQKNCSN